MGNGATEKRTVNSGGGSGGLLQELLVVPPEARVERDVRVEQVGLEQERLHDEQAGQRFADDGGLGRGAVARVHDRLQLGADELAERGRAADHGRDRAVLGVRGGAGHVATSLCVLDADQQERAHGSVQHGDLDLAGHVEEVLGHAAVGHVEDGQPDGRRVGVDGRRVDVDASRLGHHP